MAFTADVFHSAGKKRLAQEQWRELPGVLFQRFFFDQTQNRERQRFLSRTVPVPEQRGQT